MAYPARSFQDLDLSDGWTESGSPTYEANPITGNAGEAFIGDGTNNRLTHATTQLTGAETNFSVEFFIKADTIGLGDIITAQKDGADLDFEIWATTTVFTATAGNGLTGASKKTTSSTVLSSAFDDGEWHHILCAFAPSDADIFIDGAEVTYNTQDVAGANGHFDVLRASPIQMTIGEWLTSTANRYFNGSLANIGVWDGDTITASQALEIYNEWYGIGGGVGNKKTTLLHFS
jgi:hypothetical protein